MARIRLSGGIVLAGSQRVWLADDPGQEVDGTRPWPGAPVLVGPAGAGRAEVARARREAGRLLAGGGPVAAAAGIDVGGGFRTARLEGGGEARRDAVLAAMELLGPEGMDSIGSRDSLLVALFGARATKRVGAAAVAALAGGARSALRLAVAASDVLGPEQLEQVLRFEAPAAIEPVPQGTTGQLSEQLTTLLAPFPPRRRLVLVRSVWDEAVAWQRSSVAKARARRRKFSPARRDALLKQVRREDNRWWRQHATRQNGDRAGDAFLLRWVPGPSVWAAALQRAYQECVAATVLLRVTMAAEEQPVVDAVLGLLDHLAYAGTAHVAELENRVEGLLQAGAPAGVAAERAWSLARAVVLASEPGGPLPPDTPARLNTHLRHGCELALAVLTSTVDLLDAVRGRSVTPMDPSATHEWRRLAGFVRDPHQWFDALDDHDLLGDRLAGGGDPASVERIEDGLWFADLADVVASWFGHERADVSVGGATWAQAAFEESPPDPGAPSTESVTLAVAGAAQLAALGAHPGARPGDWPALVADLVADAERLGLDEKLTLPSDVAAWDGRQLTGTELRIEVARTAKQLTEWGNYMGNCIAGYAGDAGRRFALVALRDAGGKLVANVSLQLRHARWVVDQARGRFNDDLTADLDDAVARWARDLRTPSEGRNATRPAARDLPPAPARGRRRRGGSGREAVLRAAAELGQAIGDLDTDPRLDWTLQTVRPIAAEVGWGGDAADRLGPFGAVARLRRPAPLADAAGRALDAGVPLAELWEATAGRPLGAALDRLGAGGPDLRRLAEPTVPPLLRLALRDARVASARTVELASRRIRVALFELLALGDARLDRAVAARPHTGFVATAVLVLTAGHEPDGARFDSIPVAGDGALPGRPRTTLTGAGGAWADALGSAQEVGVAPARLDEVLAGAPGGHLLVPAAWLPAGGWPAFWGRAHRVTREVRRLVPAGAAIAS